MRFGSGAILPGCHPSLFCALRFAEARRERLASKAAPECLRQGKTGSQTQACEDLGEKSRVRGTGRSR
jgi:hypothetical protein